MGADLKAIVTPAADASRVAAIRNSIDLKDVEALGVYGERARLEVAASVQRILAEVRSAEAVEAAERLKRAGELIEALDPARLEARGLKGLFGSRQRRLTAVRAAFEHAGELIETVAADLHEAAERLARRAAALDRLHDQAKTFILELDAYLHAGRQALSAGRPMTVAAQAMLEHRLQALEVARRCAVEQLSLVRIVQNVDGPLAEMLGVSARAIRRWRADWTDLLGLSPERRGKRIRPDLVALYETKAHALDALVGPIGATAEARRRRADAELQMEAAAKVLGVPRRAQTTARHGAARDIDKALATRR